MIESNKAKCKKKSCGHEWYPRILGVRPIVCPRCKSYDWDDDKEEKGNGN